MHILHNHKHESASAPPGYHGNIHRSRIVGLYGTTALGKMNLQDTDKRLGCVKYID